MRRGMELLVGMALASGFLTIAPQPSRAAGIEKSLLGVRILQSYREVLRLYGAPSRIYRGNEPILVVEAKNADGDMTGGIASLGESSGGGMPSGGPGGDGPSTGGGGMSVPGRGGAPGSGAGGGGGEASTTFAQSGGFRWAYYYPKTSKLYIFIFNSEGRLIATLERGRRRRHLAGGESRLFARLGL